MQYLDIICNINAFCLFIRVIINTVLKQQVYYHKINT